MEWRESVKSEAGLKHTAMNSDFARQRSTTEKSEHSSNPSHTTQYQYTVDSCYLEHSEEMKNCSTKWGVG